MISASDFLIRFPVYRHFYAEIVNTPNVVIDTSAEFVGKLMTIAPFPIIEEKMESRFPHSFILVLRLEFAQHLAFAVHEIAASILSLVYLGESATLLIVCHAPWQ